MAVDVAPRPAAGAAVRPPGRGFLDPGYRARLRYLAFGRALPACLFAFMGWLQVQRVLAAAPGVHDAGSAIHLVPQAFYTLFCAIPVVIYLTRPMPTHRDGTLPARAAALMGTLMQLVVGAFLPVGPLFFAPPSWIGYVVLPWSIGFTGLALYGLLHLRRSLSIIPEARKLVTTGPYRMVRHPLYLAEIGSAVAVVLTSPALVPAVAFGVFVAMQLIRARFEERLLTRAFPDQYPAYRARTPRLIPGMTPRPALPLPACPAA